MEPVDLDVLVLEVHQQARLLSKDRSLTITLDDIAPVRVSGSPDRLTQLMLNLVQNAIKFTPDGGTVGLGLQQRGADAVLTVRDTGIGIAPEDQQHIFDRFYQADTSRMHHDGDGSGLGLSIARWIAEAHSGTITVESALGHGAVFTVTLPALGGHDTGPGGKDRPRTTSGKPPAHLIVSASVPGNQPQANYTRHN
jgi:signal transduction histidine kinase